MSAMTQEDKLLRMANQIATFFRTQPGEDAAERIAGHLRDFWEPRMRDQLHRYIDEQGGKDLDALVIDAAARL